MGTQQQFCLRWNNHQSNMLSVFDDLFQNEALVDVTLACDGLSIKAHKMVLSACSPYFQSLFLDNPCKHPIVILKDIRFSDLKALMDFMYKGEVNVSQEQLSTLLKTAETLKVRGLTEVAGGSELHNSLLAQPNLAQQHQQQTTQSPQLPRSSIPSAPPLPQQTQPPQPAPSSPSPKRKKVRHRHKSDRSSSQSDHDDSDSHELIEPKVEITEDSVDDERLGDHGAKVMRLSSGRTGTGTGSISGVTNDFTTNTSQGVSSSQETNSTTESQGFPGRSGNVVNLNTPPLLFNPPGPPATVQSMAPVQSIGQPPVLQGSSQVFVVHTCGGDRPASDVFDPTTYKKPKGGRPTILYEEEEEELVTLIFRKALEGTPVDFRQILAYGNELLRRQGRQPTGNMYCDPTKGLSVKWWRGFKKRHPGLPYLRLK